MTLPAGLLELARAGRERCGEDAWVFAGRHPDRHLALRSAARVVRRTVREAGLPSWVSANVLRHSYAVHQLQAGASIRQVQEDLGHQSVETTLVYMSCLPIEVESPLDALPVNHIPELLTSDCLPPFPVEEPLGYFRQNTNVGGWGENGPPEGHRDP